MSLPQTSVSRTPAIGVPGTRTRPGGIVNGNHVANGICYPGRWVSYSGDQCAHPAAEPTPGTRGGVVLKNEKSEDGSYADKEPVAVLEEGYVAVDPETAVTRDAQAFVRFVTPTTEKKGDFRADAGGATGGQTLTVVTAANTSVYTAVIRRNGGVAKTFNFTSDADATTTEIATGLKNAIDADADLVATNPTAPTILIVGTTITDTIEIVSLDARITAVNNAAAFKAPAFYRATVSAGVVELEVLKQAS